MLYTFSVLFTQYRPFAIIVTRWVNFRKKNSCMNMKFNHTTTIFRSIFTQIFTFLVEKYIFTIFAYELFKVKLKNCK